ncbi:MFS transporter [Rhizorhabdus wittichii DC-6]|nr:MFS transporter [Rhizorhabdus wittichii DC-6]
MIDQQTDGARREWRAHWRSVVAASVGVATGFSMLQFSASLFIQPWEAAFGWTRGEIALAHNGMLATAILSPFAGALLDRFGVRRPLLAAMLLTGIAYLAMTTLGGSLVQFYATYFFLQLVGILTTGLAFTRVVAARFSASRGLALACTRIGISLLGLVLPAILQRLIASEGWQAGFLLLAGIVLLVGLPVCWFGIHDLGASGRRPAASSDKTSFLHLARRDYRVALLCLCAGLGYAPLSAILSQFQPLLTEKGIAAGMAATLTGVLAGSVLIGTLVSGTLVDRIWAPLVACLFSLGPMLGCLLLIGPSPSLATALLAAMLIGMAQGAEIDIVAYLCARYFGLRHYSTIYGSTVMVMVLMSVIGQVGIGMLHDRFGDYRAGLLAAAAALGLSLITYLLLGPYPPSDDKLREEPA